MLSLALGIGACLSAFRLVDALLFRSLPVKTPERLYGLFREGKGFGAGDEKLRVLKRASNIRCIGRCARR